MPPKKKGRRPRKKKACPVCSQGLEYVDYKDLTLLKQFLNERAKIKARRSTGACTTCQDNVAEAIKTAREMALLPYVAR